MTPAQWQRARTFFEQLCDLPPEEQTQALGSSGESEDIMEHVKLMLSAERSGKLGAQLSDQAPGVTRAILGRDRVGQVIGPYTIRALIDTGGMGEVFQADRSDGSYDAQVAIKFVTLPTPEMADRFERERQMLARLEHPNIARLLDGGVDGDGVPFLVMEYIDGMPITQYCREHKLPIIDRLKIFQDIVSAVSRAHRQLIIHLDIKPDNILVDSNGRVRLLDFGIASLFDETGRGVDAGINTPNRPLTLQYASPEQVSDGLVTVATDIYQLGLLLYEMLVDHPPFELKKKSLNDAVKIICTQPPPLPGVKRSQIGKDLDAIVSRALQKNPDARYGTAANFWEDIQRFLDRRPVAARRQSGWYVASCFVRRNVVPVSTAVLSIIGLTIALIVAIHLAQVAKTEARRSGIVQNLLTGVFQQADPFDEAGKEMTLATALTSALPDIHEQVIGDPELGFVVNSMLGEIFLRLGMAEQEEASYRSALHAAKLLKKNQPQQVMAAISGLAGALVRKSPAKAVEFLQEHLPTAPEGHSDANAWVAAKYHQAFALIRLDQQAQAEVALSEMEQVMEEYEIQDPRLRAWLHQLLAYRARWDGDDEAAELHLRKNVSYLKEADTPYDYLTALHNLAMQLGQSKRYEDSEQLFLEAIQAWAVISPNNPTLGIQMSNYAGLLFRMGRQDEALTVIQQGISLLAPSSLAYQTYRAQESFANYSFATGDVRLSIEATIAATKIAQDTFGGHADQTMRRWTSLADRAWFIGDTAMAASLAQYVLANTEQISATQFDLDLANLFIDLRQYESARLLYQNSAEQASAAGREVKLRLDCTQGKLSVIRQTLDGVYANTEPSGYFQKRLLIRAALVEAALVIQAGEPAQTALAHAVTAYRVNQDVFMKVLDRWRSLSAIEDLAASIGQTMPADLRSDLSSLKELRAHSRSLLRDQYADSLRSLLADDAIDFKVQPEDSVALREPVCTYTE